MMITVANFGSLPTPDGRRSWRTSAVTQPLVLCICVVFSQLILYIGDGITTNGERMTIVTFRAGYGIHTDSTAFFEDTETIVDGVPTSFKREDKIVEPDIINDQPIYLETEITSAVNESEYFDEFLNMESIISHWKPMEKDALEFSKNILFDVWPQLREMKEKGLISLSIEDIMEDFESDRKRCEDW